ncbi:acyl-CoA dehydrogenase family protein [Albimonas sp. CAU 1670]|uniref:acyl-CoA dehydrogenase family protein n=1 Tax=Albimonas sp. CAU 1670 TaxID=3032599 RepID=UPI0023DA4A2A|nr:acyl-CoA dehydrogenase family protein [Albimonas sp. CAU 1670]MDF2233845.1 acyl-CoA dehydrogenase family protein [Albimonas sp. CAU 1670]
MSLDNDTATLLADQLDRLFAQKVDAKLLRAVEAGEPASALEAEVEALGLTLALVPEEAGGAGLAWSEVGGVLEALGRFAAPVALGERMAAAWAMAQAGMEVPEDVPLASWDRLTLDGETVSGACVVPWGQAGGRVLVTAGEGEAAKLVLLEIPEGRALPTIGRDPRLVVEFAGATPLASGPAPMGGEGLPAALAVVRAGQIAGAINHALAESIDYGNTRVQFGRPIGKFQAIQHLVAEQAGEAAAAKAAVQLALRSMDAAPSWQAAAVAKIRAGLAVEPVAAVAHAVHGAIGVTEEHMLHHTTRRLWQWRDEAGDENAWSERLGRDAIAGGGKQLWKTVVALSGGR